jgi:hypothetical protein
MESFDDAGNLLQASGFNMIYLPFRDEIRKPPVHAGKVAQISKYKYMGNHQIDLNFVIS